MSRESFYLAMIIVGCGGLLYFGWPAMKWAWAGPKWLWEIPKRTRDRERSLIEAERAKQNRRNQTAIEKMERLRDLIADEFDDIWADRHDVIECRAEIEILKTDLRGIGLGLPPNKDHSNLQLWHDYISTLLPHVRRYGIDHTITRINKGGRWRT